MVFNKDNKHVILGTKLLVKNYVLVTNSHAHALGMSCIEKSYLTENKPCSSGQSTDLSKVEEFAF
jgi:hypothetical protein